MKESTFNVRIDLPGGGHADAIGEIETHVPEIIEIDESGDDDKIVDLPKEQGE